MIIILKKIISLKNFLITFILIIGCNFPKKTFALNLLNEYKIQTNLQWKKQENYFHKKFIKNLLQSKPYFIFKKKPSNFIIEKFTKIPNNFLHTILNTYENYNYIFHQYYNINQNIIFHILKQKSSTKINNQSINTLKKSKIEITLIKMYIFKSLRKFQYLELELTPKIERSQKINNLKFVKLKINNYKKIFYPHKILFQNKHHYLNNILQISQPTTAYTIKTLSEENCLLPTSILNQLNINNNLSNILNQQTFYLKKIILQQKKTTKHILQVHQTFNNLLEQAQWLNKSSALKEILRAQISKLPNTPNFQKLDSNIAQLRKSRLKYEHQIIKLSSLLSQSKKDDGTPLTQSQQHILKKQIIIQKNLINALLNSYNQQILELIKLKVSYEQLKNALQEIQKAMHRYLFWVTDIYPINISYPLDIYHDIYRLFIEERFKKQIILTLKIICSNQTTLILIIFSSIISIGLYLSIHQRYQEFLKRSNKFIGKVKQDNFLITFNIICYSIIIASPIPIFWLTIGYIFSHIWVCPIAISIGNGINATTSILWISIISAYFASPNGLFINHFGWPKKRIQKVFSRYYALSIGIIVLLTMTLIIFNNYNTKEFYPTLGRLCFIILCIYLTCITNNLKRSKLPLYINKYDSSNNIINHFLWNIMICAPIIASIACIFGYFFVAQELLMRLEISLFIWILLLIIYHLVRRWISIQRRRIAFERAKKERAQKLALRTHNKLNFSQYQITHNKLEPNKNNKKTLDLDTINTQSLQLIRSILTLVAILLMTFLWSELHYAFSFLENITLWDVTSTIKGVNNIQPITLNSFLIAILVIIITTKTVHNIPAFLELALLQHLNLTPGTGYAITTLTKYILMLLGSIIGFSLIGIEWSKIQWLIAALGVGLGFGLQEIFANFISGLMILFEKPIRIGDTITICNLTGNVTRINTRATTITDWDHKEIIIPNKEFITKQFVNWSLSDTITRVVLKVPGSTQMDVKKMTKVLLQIVKNSSLALSTPPPEVYLSDLQQGFPVFEIRMYVSDTKLRMPLCHQVHLLITEYYQKNGIKLPYLLNYIYKNQLTTIQNFPPY